MRQKRLSLVLLLAVLSGAVAGYSILTYLRQRPTRLIAAESNRSSLPVVVAARDLDLGQVVTEDDVRLVDWPSDAVPEGYARSLNEVVGRGLIAELRTNEPVLNSKLAGAAEGAGLPPLIPTGMRALSVRVDEVVGVAGFVTPQTRVDVILTIQPNGSAEPRSKVILQNVRALAAGQEIRRDEDGKPMTVTVVTVLVTPEDAEKLVLASTQGRIQMALRNTLDLETVETDGERVSSLFGTRRPGATVRTGTTAATNNSPSIIEMYKGGVRTLISY